MISQPLHKQHYSLDHEAFLDVLTHHENLLIIQDLDGVCMELVRDPLTRKISPDYVNATQRFKGHFFVLTNGEHVGRRGVNRIVDKALGNTKKTSYLPGLAAGGVQWQTQNGKVSHPGISDAEIIFLAQIPSRAKQFLGEFIGQNIPSMTPAKRTYLIEASVLDNFVSPTINLNIFAETLQTNRKLYEKLQRAIAEFFDDLLAKAAELNLSESFFVHYAPNLGRDQSGKEIVRFATDTDSGTTDFQFMLKGAVKEAGVPVLLNHYYYQQTGKYPLGENFNARQAPQTNVELLQLIKNNFDPKLMPLIVGVGDTITGSVEEGVVRRGGSDRLFLQLIQKIGIWASRGNIVTYVDSSGGELQNRKPLQLGEANGKTKVIRGVTDAEDPLQINVAFPGGHREYTEVFMAAAQQRQSKLQALI